MGGTKKRPLAAMEKNQQGGQEDETAATKTKKKTKESGAPGERKRVDVLVPRQSDQEFMKLLTPLKAITMYGAARTLSVNAGVAKQILASLESKGLVTKVGGFSGHYVWSPVSAAS